MSHTGDRLLAGLKRRGVVPTSQALLSDADILAMADDLVESSIVPLVLSLREDYFLTYARQLCVKDQVAYPIPYRAIGRALREIKLVGSTSLTATTGDAKRRLTHISVCDEHLFRTGVTPMGFYPFGDKIALVPVPQSADYALELWYNLKPSRIVKMTQAALVQSVSGDTVTVLTTPTEITTGCCCDFVMGEQGNAIMSMDIAVTGIAGNQISFGTGLVPTDLAAGDWISVSETSPVIQLPDVTYPLLETLLAQRVLKSIGDNDGANALDKDATRENTNVKMAMEPRVEGEPKKVINRAGLLRGSRSRYRFGWMWR